MRIAKLYLKGFIAMYVAQKKKEITIVFPKDKVIHLLYGDMGSGKTFILGHCQPWHDFGTLDPRNEDKQILDGENGLKIIEYEDDQNYYIIRHEYIWSSNRHINKHYIKKNSEELNSNGNLTTFNSIIYNEFGIEQDYLKLFRIGSNVINMINMKAMERKRFIAMILQDTQIYLQLHKRMIADLKALNAQASFVMNQLGSLQFTKADRLSDRLDEIKDAIKLKTKKQQSLMEDINKNEGIMYSKLDGMKFDEYYNRRIEFENRVSLEKLNLREMENKLTKFSSLSVEDISKKIGEVTATCNRLKQDSDVMQNEYNQITIQLDKIGNQLSLFSNDAQKQQLKLTYETLSTSVSELEKEVKQYPYKYSYQELIELLSIVETINMDITSIRSYNMDDIITVILNGSSAIMAADKKAQILRVKQQNLIKTANNFQYSGTYQEPYKLFRAAFCPTKDCPYYRTHPAKMKSNLKKEELEGIIQRKNEEIMRGEAMIARFESFPTILALYNKIKRLWETVRTPLSEMKLLKENNLEMVINKRKEWVDQYRLTIYIELAQKRSELYTLRERLLSAKDQLNRIELSDRDKLESENAKLLERKNTLLENIVSTSEAIIECEDNLNKLNDDYLSISSKVELEKSIKDNQIFINELSDKVLIMVENEELFKSMDTSTLLMREELSNIKSELKELQSEMMQLTITLYNLIIDSISPKSGIPLHMVELYMNGCLDSINDLIFGMFEDDLEIERFSPNEDSFYIPYNRNGHIVDDISKASQGEKSIIGMAISFAMMQQSSEQSFNMKYNIPLLDEPDAALHTQDREKFLTMLLRHMKQIHGEQVIIISHNQTFEGYPLHLILTSDTTYEITKNQCCTKL